MEEQSDKLRSLLDDVKFNVSESLLPGLIKHINEDDSYHFFRYVQELLEYRRIDGLLLEKGQVWFQARKMYAERFPWLHRPDLKYGPDVPEERERTRRLVRALNKAFEGVPEQDYKEDWITEYLALNRLTWDDVANGRHLRTLIPGTTYTQYHDRAALRLDPNADLRGLASRGPIKSDVAMELDDNIGDDRCFQGQEDDGPEQQEAIAKMAISAELLTPEDSEESSEIPLPMLDNKPQGDENLKTPTTPVHKPPTPDVSPEWLQVGSSDGQATVDTQTPGAPSQELVHAPPQEVHAPPPKPAAGIDWFPGWHKAARNGKETDFQQQPYKGWLASGPVPTLKRISNFLSDEDIDSTPDWASRIAEITEYLVYLLVNYDEERHSWGSELREVIDMVRTHIAYEDYHYGTPPLTLHFDETPLRSKRLPPVKGSSIGIESQKAVTRDPWAPRNLLHGPPAGVWDNMYKIHDGKLGNIFLKELRADEKLYWTTKVPEVPNTRGPATQWHYKHHDRAIPHERPSGFNMCETEDNTFIACMQQGPLRTYEELKKSCRFKYRAREHEETGDTKPRRNKQLLQFAKFRGANRAALTSALRTLGSQTREIQAVSSPWRKLIVRTPEQRRKQKPPGIIWQSAKLKNDQIPKDDLDPMAYNFWHTKMLDGQENQARKKIWEVETARKTLVGLNKGKYPPVPKTNFKGPFTAIDVNEERYGNEQFLKRLKRTLRDLETASRLSPRPLLADVLVNARWGLQGMPPAVEEIGMFPDDVVDKSDDREKDVRIMKHDDVDLELLERMSHASINDMMLQRLPSGWSPRKRIFADHIQALVADIGTASIFFLAGKQATLKEVVDAVNTRVNGPVRGVAFTHEEATEYLNDLGTFKRISINRGGTEPTYSRPETTIHPEQTFRWNVIFNARRRHAPTYLTYQALTNLNPVLRRMDKAITTPLLKGTAWRLGKTIRHLEQVLASNPPTDAQRAALRTTYRDLTRNWERKVEAHRDHDGTRRTMDYRDVIKHAEPARFKPEWASDDAQIVDGADLGPVYAGILREAHENKSMLWPARSRQVLSIMGTREVWSRDGVWSWARPDIKPARRYFHIRRWPVHLQSKETQERIRRSKETRAYAVLRSVNRKSDISGESSTLVEPVLDDNGDVAMELDRSEESSTLVDSVMVDASKFL